MHRPLSLSICALLALVAAGCGATHADAHHTTRHASAAPPPISSPLWVADQYFVASEFPDEAVHVTGEFAHRFADRPTLGSLLAPRVHVAVRPILEHDDSAIVGATITDPDRQRVSEWYSYLVRDRGSWKMYAVRTVEFSPAFHARLDTLAKAHSTADARSGARADIVLVVESDSALRAFVASHVTALDSLVAAYAASPGAPSLLDVADASALARQRGAAPGDPNAAVHRLLVATGASTVFRNPANPACTFVRIAGEGREQVGAFRADAGCRIPPMSPAGLVYAERVEGDWYIYRAL